MRRAPLLSTLLLLVLAASAATGARAQDAPPKLSATLAACEVGLEPAQRFAVFTASMPAKPGTKRMSMRFDLQERRAGDESLQRVRAPKLGSWNRSKPGAGGFVYTKRVTRLAQGRWYRAIVRFRWHGARGKVLESAKRVTPFCHQADQRANLQLESLRAARAGSYLVTIVNVGMTAAPASSVAVEPRPERSFERRVPPLQPGERTTVVVEGDRCDPEAVVVVQLDRDKVVDESREDDNRVESDCPAADRVD